jgi:predicted dehydrogenase
VRTQPTRRSFLKSLTAGATGFWVGGTVGFSESRAASETIRFGCIGVGGEGRRDMSRAARNGQVVAICDIDERALDAASVRFPSAKRFVDWRKMFDQLAGQLDAVTISTPDHSHAAATARAMREGLACYTQKPLTRTISEARKLSQLAAETDVVTQMGNQYSALSAMREAVALVQSGALGEIREVHVWSDRPQWAQGMSRPNAAVAVPPQVHWDLFIGPAPMRPYHPSYHPFKWRAWWDFGTGALGDMGCHTINLPFAALDLRDPIAVCATTSGHNRETLPKWSRIEYEFGATEQRAKLKMFWYDGGQLPREDLLQGATMVGSGALLVGAKGSLYAPGDYANDYLLLGIDRPESIAYERSIGHFEEFAAAVRGQGTTYSDFAGYAGPLTETVLLGNLAVWADGKRIEWDARTMTAANAPELNELVFPEYRSGYSI